MTVKVSLILPPHMHPPQEKKIAYPPLLLLPGFLGRGL